MQQPSGRISAVTPLQEIKAMKLRDKKASATGAGQGIEMAAALTFGREGADIMRGEEILNCKSHILPGFRRVVWRNQKTLALPAYSWLQTTPHV